MYLSAAGSHSVYVSETSWFKGGSDDSPRWCLDPQAAARKFSTMGVELTDPRGLQLSNLNSAAPVQWEGSSRFHDSKVSVSLEVPSVGDCAVLLRTRVMGSPTDATAWNQAISEMAELSLHQNRN